MKVSSSLPALSALPLPIRRFGLPLLAALLLHGLWWSLLQLRQSRLPAPPALAVRDDTPELLRFSRRQEPLVVDVSPIPLTPVGPPPPPPLVSKPPPLSSPPAAPVRAAARSAARSTAGSAARPAAPAPRRRPQARVPLAPPAPPALLAALAELRQSPPPAGQARPAAAVSAETWQGLWQAARPARQLGGAWSRLPDGVQCRQLPAGFALPRGLALRHGQGVGLGREVLLVWKQGSQVWLLRAPGMGAGPDSAAGAKEAPGQAGEGSDQEGAQEGAAGTGATGGGAGGAGAAAVSPAPARPAR